MRTLAALAVPGTWTHPGGVLVGRTVANAALLEALATHGSFERVVMVAGEDADLPPLQTLFDKWKLPPRAQDARNTCSVFVTVGAFEFASSKRHDRAMPFSVEYSNWASNRVIRNSTVDRGQLFHDRLKGWTVS